MERRKAAPVWRELGFIITVIAAVCLAVVLWQSYKLSVGAAGDTMGLYREQQGLEFERRLFPLYLDLQRYRVSENLVHPRSDGARRRIDAAFNDPQNVRLAAAIDVGDTWQSFRASWKTAESNHARPQERLSKLIRSYSGFLQKVQDNSGVSFDAQRFGQELGAEIFAVNAYAASELLQADYYVENAQAQHRIKLKDRMRLSNFISGSVNNFDPSGDEVDGALTDYQRRFPGAARDVAKYRRDVAAIVAVGDQFRKRTNSLVLEREYPAGNARGTQAFTNRAVSALVTYNRDLATVLQNELDQRVATLRARNNTWYVAVLLAAALLVGIMMLIAELVARRDRMQIEEAQRESTRLAAELARQKAEDALRLSEAQFRAIFDGASLGIAILDRSGDVRDANTVFRHMYGANGASVLDGHEEQFAQLMRKERDAFEFEQHVMTVDGHEAWTDSTISLVSDEEGSALFAICMFRDVTELKRNQRRMLHDMTHDGLTGLPNRMQFERSLREEFAKQRDGTQTQFAVLFVDLDRFKDINESLGHEAGDFVLSHVAQRLRAQVESTDVVARLGSDEFALLVRNVGDSAAVDALARRILNGLAKPVALAERSIFVSGSVGIALERSGYERAEDMMRDADIAMRYAKSHAGAPVAIFDSQMHARAEKRLQLTTDIRLALERGEFQMVYQPIVRVNDGELTGCEALIRWLHPFEGAVMPADFMPIAEQTGLAIPIGRFVMRSVCEQFATWKRFANLPDDFAMNVNVSAAELLDPDFEEQLLHVVAEFGIDPGELTLEITESVMLDAGTRPNAIVERMRAHGFKICIDDFGTGYSSLRYLQQFKVDAIKIDRSFVANNDGDVASEPIVRTLMTLAEAFDVRVVAEGVETQRQRDVLRNVGCRYAQGFFYERPISSAQLAGRYPALFSRTQRSASA